MNLNEKIFKKQQQQNKNKQINKTLYEKSVCALSRYYYYYLIKFPFVVFFFCHSENISSTNLKNILKYVFHWLI